MAVLGGMSLVMPTSRMSAGRDLVHEVLVHPVEDARALERLATEEEVARDRQLVHQGRVLVDGLDTVGDGVVGAVDARPSCR